MGILTPPAGRDQCPHLLRGSQALINALHAELEAHASCALQASMMLPPVPAVVS